MTLLLALFLLFLNKACFLCRVLQDQEIYCHLGLNPRIWFLRRRPCLTVMNSRPINVQSPPYQDDRLFATLSNIRGPGSVDVEVQVFLNCLTLMKGPLIEIFLLHVTSS
jgi:hypothetical protein